MAEAKLGELRVGCRLLVTVSIKMSVIVANRFISAINMCDILSHRMHLCSLLS